MTAVDDDAAFSARWDVPDADAMQDLGRALAGVLTAGDLVLLIGPLGAGKTTLTRGLGEGLGVRGAVTSPTFVIARLHPVAAPGGTALLHVDAYRLGSFGELDDLDLDTALDECVTVVEWGEGLAEPLSPHRLEVRIERAVADESVAPSTAEAAEVEADPRVVTLTGVGERWRGVAVPAAAGPVAD